MGWTVVTPTSLPPSEPSPEWEVVGSIQGPAGPAGPPGGSFIHVQETPAAEWTVVHNLGMRRLPTLVLASAPEESVFTDVHFIDDDSLLIQWTQPETGWAYL